MGSIKYSPDFTATGPEFNFYTGIIGRAENEGTNMNSNAEGSSTSPEKMKSESSDDTIQVVYGYQFLANSDREQSEFKDDGHVFLQLGSDWTISDHWSVRPAMYFQRSLVGSSSNDMPKAAADVDAIVEADVVALGLSPKYRLSAFETESGALETYTSMEFIGFHVFGDDSEETKADYFYETALGLGVNLETRDTTSNIEAAIQHSDRFSDRERVRFKFYTSYNLKGVGFDDAGSIFIKLGANISMEESDEVETNLMLGIKRDAPDIFNAVGGLLGLTKKGE